MKLLLALITSVLIIGCYRSSIVIEPTFTQMSPPLQGELSGDYYYSPERVYRFNIPAIQACPKELINDKSHTISFMDDLGNLIRVEVAIASEEEMNYFSALILKLSYKQVLQELFDSCALKPICNTFPLTDILDEGFIELDPIGPVYYAVLTIPGGSTLADAKTGKRVDSKRVYLVSVVDNHIVVLSAQESMQTQSAIEMGLMSDEASCQKLLNDLKAILQSYEIAPFEL